MERIKALIIMATAWLFSKLPRMTWTALAASAALVGLYIIAPHRMELALYKVSFVPLAGVVAYWTWRELFPDCRPSKFLSPPDADGWRAIKPGCERLYLFAVSGQVVMIVAGMACMAVGL
jgi:hypothetical protein